MKHRIHGEPQPEENIIEWRFRLDEDGWLLIEACRPGNDWEEVAFSDNDARFSVDPSALNRLGFKRFDFE